MKVHKYISKNTSFSLRHAEKLIAAGHVKVNGKPALIGQLLHEGDVITLDDDRWVFSISKAHSNTDLIVLAMYKPLGVVCSNAQQNTHVSSYELLHRYLDAKDHLAGEKFFSVGRLDINTSGLLLWVNHGTLAHRLMHPSFSVDRNYVVKVCGVLSSDALETLKNGVMLDGVRCHFVLIETLKSAGLNHTYKVMVQTGRYRMIRRMFQSVGLKVVKLKRISYGSFHLPEYLKPGGVHILTAIEKRWFKAL